MSKPSLTLKVLSFFSVTSLLIHISNLSEGLKCPCSMERKKKKKQAIQDEKIMQMQIKHNSAVRGQSVFLCRHSGLCSVSWSRSSAIDSGGIFICME